MNANCPDQSDEGWWTRGVNHHQRGELAEAEACYRHIPPTSPVYHATLGNLGAIALQTGRFDEAASWLQGSLAMVPTAIPVRYNLGLARWHLGQWDQAEAAFRLVLARQPDHHRARFHLGALLLHTGHLDAAAATFRHLLLLAPDHPEAHHHLALTLYRLGRLDEAAHYYRQALATNPENVASLSGLGSVLLDQGHPSAAVANFRQALVHQPHRIDLHNNLGVALQNLGFTREAQASFRQVLELDPKHPGAANNALTCLLYQPELTPPERARHFRRWADGLSVQPAPAFPDGRKDPDRQLRIGYLSSDFRTHPIADNLLPLFERQIHQDFTIFGYYLGHLVDETTHRLEHLCHHWRTVTDLPDEQIAALLREDGLDMLVYLGGHFDQNRPQLCRYRAAPVQVSLFAGTSSGFAEMDWWLTDGFLHPDDNGPERFTEQLYRLPCLYQYLPPATTAVPGTPPADHLGFITFGSFNNPAKINDHILDLWRDILSAVPQSRLLLKFMNWFGDPVVQERCLARLCSQGLSADRIRLWGEKETHEQHLAHFRQLDIALDPFPFNGATTSFQSLWMGVPMIALRGDHFLSRVGASFLHHIQTPELIARTPEEYVAKAVELAADRERLREYHRTLRQKVLDSPLCRGEAYAASVMTAFREMWRRWCLQPTPTEKT